MTRSHAPAWECIPACLPTNQCKPPIILPFPDNSSRWNNANVPVYLHIRVGNSFSRSGMGMHTRVHAGAVARGFTGNDGNYGYITNEHFHHIHNIQ
ncbi:MAG: hypothetical protein HQ591_06975 [candidate division Zixibacteria bacterium]|nr:hypothetical protein [Candidatus Tariuqbacter arcticus]